MAFLGETVIREIAGEKSWYNQAWYCIVTKSAKQHADAEEVLAAKCAELGSELRVVDEAIEPISYGMGEQRFNYGSWADVTISLAGTHQFSNASLALLAVALRIRTSFLQMKRYTMDSGTQVGWTIWNARTQQ